MCFRTVPPRPFKHRLARLAVVIGLGVSLGGGVLVPPPSPPLVNGVRLRPRSSAGLRGRPILFEYRHLAEMQTSGCRLETRCRNLVLVLCRDGEAVTFLVGSGSGSGSEEAFRLRLQVKLFGGSGSGSGAKCTGSGGSGSDDQLPI